MFTFETKNGWSLTLYAENKKKAINMFLEIVGPGVQFEVIKNK